MKKKLIKLTESDLHRIIENAVNNYLNEEGEGGVGGATSCGNVMQGGGSNPSAGQYEAPFGADKETKKRNKDFKNGSISMQRTDVVSRPIYSPKK